MFHPCLRGKHNVLFQDWAGYPMVNPTQNFLSAVKKEQQYVKLEMTDYKKRSTSPQIITQEYGKQHTHSFIQKRVLTTNIGYYNGFFPFRGCFILLMYAIFIQKLSRLIFLLQWLHSNKIYTSGSMQAVIRQAHSPTVALAVHLLIVQWLGYG